MRISRWGKAGLILTGLLLAATLGLLIAHQPLPDLAGRSSSTAVQDTADTRLGRAIVPLSRVHPGKSGVIALASGRDAFAARMLLADAAERSLDIQYYIWNADMSGTLLFEALHRAADRGVRVRLLLDDNGSTGLDRVIAALDAQANIEVRLFNPFVNRNWRLIGFLTDFSRLNRRMHNKSFTADNQATIIGGRNIGDEYFDAGEETLFLDLDVLAIGPVVDAVSRDFDRYWASASAYPVDRILPAAGQPSAATLETAAALVEHDPDAAAYMQAIRELSLVRALLGGHADFEWTDVRLVSDDPAKGLGRAADEQLMSHRLGEIIGRPQTELLLISPYFVPTASGVAYFSGLAADGVEVSVLTNSLEATDVAAVHAGYAKWREDLLAAGVQLFELKRESAPPPARGHGLAGSSAASLHAKTFAVDRSRVFIGSYNFDPRSARLNTEMGFVIDSAGLARKIVHAFATDIPARAYRLRLDADGNLQWVEQVNGKTIVHDEEPGSGFWKRIGIGILSALPIDWLL